MKWFYNILPRGFEKIKEELENLKSVERPKVIQQIEARDKGDLSENAEYDIKEA